MGIACAFSLRRFRLAVALALMLATPAACGGTEPAAEPTSAGTPAVYELRVSASDAHGNRFEFAEWINPDSGEWRRGGETTFTVFAGDTYAKKSEDGVYLRSGSKGFLGYLSDSILLDALRSYLRGSSDKAGIEVSEGAEGPMLRFDRKGLEIEASIESWLSTEAAAERKLFHIPETGVTTIAREVPIGASPTLPVNGYWLGQSIAGRDAVFATEYWREGSGRDAATLYSVYYELPSADGRNSAQPGQVPPRGEISVTSIPSAMEISQAHVQAFNGVNGNLTYEPWPRIEVTLLDGTKAVAVSNRQESEFTVITDRTLITVRGNFTAREIVEVASRLRPVGA